MLTITLTIAWAVWWVVRLVLRVVLALARPSMRFAAFVLFIVAVIALVADLTPFMDHGSTPSITSVSEHWQSLSPLSLKASENTVTTAAGGWAWQLLQILVLNWPTFLIFGLLGMLAAHIGRQRKILNVYVN